jgi:hypothetical protein
MSPAPPAPGAEREEGMRRALAPLTLATLLPAGAAGVSAAQPPQGPYEDGAAQASAGAPLLRGLLDGYAARPPWAVAGVDYAVGVPHELALKDPATLSLRGVSLDAARHVIRVGGAGVRLDGYDFGRDGGWGLYLSDGARDTSIENCRFTVGANNLVPVNAAVGSGDLTIRHSTFDGGGGRSGDVWALVNYNGSGRFVAEYDSFVGAPADAIDFGAGTMTTLVRYDVFSNLGTAPGSHPDSVQYAGVTSDNAVIAFNTVYQPLPSGMQGIQLEAQNGSRLAHSTIGNNVIVARGGARTMSYGIAVGEDAGNRIDGALIAHNYLDMRGAYGAFYPPKGTGLAFVGNVDMVSAATLPTPAETLASNVVDLTLLPPGGDGRSAIALRLNVTATVSGVPELALSDGSRASFTAGSGTDTLHFGLTPPLAGARTKPVGVRQIVLPPGASVRDGAGNPVDFGGLAGRTPLAAP